LATVILLITAVNEVQWVPEGIIVWPSAALGLLLATYLAKRSADWRLAWALILCYGILFNIIWLGRLIPAGSTPIGREVAGVEIIRQNWALFVDRIEGWLLSISSGGRSDETVVFALGLGLVAWLVAAYAAWSVFRQRRPLLGVMTLAFALGLNAFFGNASLWPLPLFVGLAVLLVVTIQFNDLELSWIKRKVDYPDDVRLDFIVIGAAIALGLLTFSIIVPSVNVKAVSRFFLEQPIVSEVEDTLERLFAGVNQPRRASVSSGVPGPGASGGLPTTFLIGNPPELYETVVMTAAVSPSPQGTVHWRGASYDTYTGQGWSISTEREEIIPAEASIPIIEIEKKLEISQTVHWVQDDRSQRYTLGLPMRFNQEIVARWRGVDDLSRVSGSGSEYQALSQASEATIDELRNSPMDGAPAALMARYTQLPDSVPERVHQLALEVAGDRVLWPSQYDQAKAIERFLRQYPYSLEVELPGDEEDVVDFFLFNLQKGYCDYYASSMVIMARSLGIPARLGSGYLAQPADEKDIQIIYQINAHSWAELFFEDYGWVEFEPTAAFPASSPIELEGGELAISGNSMEFGLDPVPVPPQGRKSLSLWWALGALILVIPLGYWLRSRRGSHGDRLDSVQQAYAQLRHGAEKLGQPTPPSQTPGELRSSLTTYINNISDQWYVNHLNPPMLSAEIQRLTIAFEVRQYSGRKPPMEPGNGDWRFIRTRLILLRLANWLKIERRR
jgi:transglutaminase-like putative cysteine protease